MHGRHWHPRTWLLRLLASLCAVAAILGVAGAVRAGNYSFTATVPVTLTGSGVTVQILSGSSADSVDIQATTIAVQVAGGESLTLRYPGPNPGTLANTGGISGCNNVGGNNDVTVAGPATVTFTPDSATPCAAAAGGGGGGGGGSTTIAPYATVSSPNGGETYDAGTTVNVFWTAGGSQVTAVRLALSTDGGATFPTVIADNETNDGFYAWTVPDLASIAARVRVEALVTGGSVGASDVSDANFVIRSLPATVVPSPTIDADKSLPPPPETPLCIAGTRIKLVCAAGAGVNDPCRAVYYCGKDGKRYVFPDAQTYFSWYADFAGIVTIAPGTLAQVRVGGNITYRPGSLVKVQSDPKVYVVSRGGILRWVPTEDIALALFGADWSKRVRDVPVAFFLNYVLGAPMEMP